MAAVKERHRLGRSSGRWRQEFRELRYMVGSLLMSCTFSTPIRAASLMAFF
ncbi:hypothetical protein [Streptomyces sp. UG1]|uniref:hypothetical protein n=1 Tax=Streptomyces sp. UG1 TaxID=3417652 RepID=UPI003CEA6539